MTTYCIYDGLLLLDIVVERHSKNSVSFNLKVDEDMQQSRDCNKRKMRNMD